MKRCKSSLKILGACLEICSWKRLLVCSVWNCLRDDYWWEAISALYYFFSDKEVNTISIAYVLSELWRWGYESWGILKTCFWHATKKPCIHYLILFKLFTSLCILLTTLFVCTFLSCTNYHVLTGRFICKSKFWEL